MIGYRVLSVSHYRTGQQPEKVQWHIWLHYQPGALGKAIRSGYGWMPDFGVTQRLAQETAELNDGWIRIGTTANGGVLYWRPLV